jgi:Zn finger protein HypA/HybF involved in hydrogenase expression
MQAPPTFTCVDCGGATRLLSHAPEDGWEPGDVVAYRCPDCGERFDVVLGEEDEDRPD